MTESQEEIIYQVVSMDEMALRRDIAYAKLSEFAANREDYYNDKSRLNLKKLLSKDVVMFAARGIDNSEDFVDEAFRAIEFKRRNGYGQYMASYYYGYFL